LSYRGSGIEIAVMDNGFPDVNTNKFYKKANDENRIRVGWDFVNNNDTLFDNENGNHGNYVISTMVSDVEGELVGTAPDATYFVFSTEDNQNEGLPEEYNWAMAAEKADDLMSEYAIITTSLGYSNGFDVSSTNHTYADMNGNTTPITIAADLAAAKGFLVINSAGNSGNDAWKYITAPSDGDSVLCIGAVDSKGVITNFSSRGPSSDGRVKPNVCAKGRDAAAVTKNGQLTTISGTSFSCPITSGMAACLWQAFPDKNNMEIFEAIEKSAHLYLNPNDDYGFGIPNFKLAYFYLLNKDIEEKEITIYPNPVESDLNFSFKHTDTKEAFYATIYTNTGKEILSQEFLKNNLLNFYTFNNISSLADGVYILTIVINKEKITSRFLKQ